jgi:transcriptional regulator with XRE-family HTH domain
MAHDEARPPETVFPGFAELRSDVRDVVDQLAELRRERGMSQTEVAARMHTSQSAVARLEAGRDDIRVSTLRRYAGALGHTVHFGVEPVDQGDEPA